MLGVEAAAIADAEIRQVDEAGSRLVVLVPAGRVGQRTSRTRVSRSRLNRVAAKYSDRYGVRIEWLQVGQEEPDARRAAVETALRAKFPQLVEEVVFSPGSDRPAYAWVELRDSPLARTRYDEIAQAASQLVEVLEAGPLEVLVGRPKRTPSNLTLLRAIKVTAPTSETQIRADLLESGYDVDGSRLAVRIDTLRRQGFIVRFRDGRLSLSEKGVRSVPHGNFRGSSDIERVLALAKRRW